MASQVQICNLALQRVGNRRITSLSDGTEVANACAAAYDLAVEDVLSTCSWTTATFRAVLAQTTATPAFGYDYQYQLPTDPKFLRIIEVYSTNPANSVKYAIEGDKLLSDDSAVSIRYVGMVTSPDSFGPFVTKAVIAKLAIEIAYTSSATLGLMDRLKQDYRDILEECMSLDATQGSADVITVDGYLRDR